jgi:hypothetical protein
VQRRSTPTVLLAALAFTLAFAGVATAAQPLVRRRATVVTVTETEYKITLPHMPLKPGPYRFEVANRGKIVHAFAIRGPGVSTRRTGSIRPGATASLSVTLKKGTYQVWCPTDGHRALGMHTVLKVR